MFLFAPKVTSHFGYFCKKSCHQQLSKKSTNLVTLLASAKITPGNNNMKHLKAINDFDKNCTCTLRLETRPIMT